MTQDKIDAARLALNEAKVLASLLSESILAAGIVTSSDTAERHAVLSVKTVEAIEAASSELKAA